MSGLSALAIPAAKQWDAEDRPKDWQGHVYGLVVHTTGGGLPAKADEKGVYHTVAAVNYYTDKKSHGCHYVNGWRGMAGGDLLQIANENEQAKGVGVTNAKDPAIDQRRSIELGRFEQDLPQVLVSLWKQRWPGRNHSLELLPGTQSANSCYIHVECVPCVYSRGGKLVTGTDAEPMRAGLRFTQAQHDTVAALAMDIAQRNGWPLSDKWWLTPRLLGHEDLTPISRHDNNGGWDPGYLRTKPYFDWDYVYGVIEAQSGTTSIPGASQEFLAVSAAHGNGVRGENELTNLVFFARHPELGGRKIEAHETALASEWKQIRDAIVRPALRTLEVQR